MTLSTMRSEDARRNWRDLLDAAHRGLETVIERYQKPTAVVVGYTEWKALKRQHAEYLDQLASDTENHIPWVEAEKQLIADGVLDG